ncbi:MAG TPA: hypothetical protein VIM42_01310 [Clostridium sp.]
MDKNMLNDVKNINAPRNTKHNIKDDINENKNLSSQMPNQISNNTDDFELILKKKSTQKDDKKSFLLYMDAKELKDLDKLVAETDYSRNELILIMLNYAKKHVKF